MERWYPSLTSIQISYYCDDLEHTIFTQTKGAVTVKTLI